MTDWQPKLGDPVMVVNPNNWPLEYGEHVIGQTAIFKALVMSGQIPVAVVEWDGACYCFRMDMLAQPVDPRRAVLEELCFVCTEIVARDLADPDYSGSAKKQYAIDCALRKLDNLPPF